MNYIEKFHKYDKLVKDNIYYSKIGASNILFIGGCRSFVYAIFFEEICKYVPYFQHAQFGFSVIGVHIIDLLKRSKTNNLKYIIKNADYIVCEQIRNYGFLNTCKSCEQNIFNNFDIKEDCKIIQIPNLEFRYYSNDLIYDNSDNKNIIESVITIKQQNLKKFLENCRKYEFYKLSEYIEQNINKERFFNTFNHPNNCLMLELFNELIEKLFEQKLKEPMLNILKKIKIFDHPVTATKITEIDYHLGISRSIV